MLPGFFLTGTDTGVGKTMVCAGLIAALRQLNVAAAGMKPVSSGCVLSDGGWVNDDALQLQIAANGGPDLELINPYALPEATAPQIAAALHGVRIEERPILDAYERLSRRYAPLLVEGVGGYAVPFAKGYSQRDLAKALGLPVILVVGLRLGCINHSLLTAEAIETDGLELVGWIGNSIDPDMDYAGATTQSLSEHLPVPCLGLVGHVVEPDVRRMSTALLGIARRIIAFINERPTGGWS
jgi:dethiobiotin synthetase